MVETINIGNSAGNILQACVKDTSTITDQVAVYEEQSNSTNASCCQDSERILYRAEEVIGVAIGIATQ